ncbi:MAG: TetR-like C-terminal domain-containing protein, partial [Acidimicrobiia bacterium]
GTDGFRRFALERPHLYRLNFEQTLLAPPGVVPPWAASGRRARTSLHRWTARLAAHHSHIDADDTVIQFHALCQGLASTEINGVMGAMGASDLDRHWHESLTAYVTGLVVTARADTTFRRS